MASFPGHWDNLGKLAPEKLNLIWMLKEDWLAVWH